MSIVQELKYCCCVLLCNSSLFCFGLVWMVHSGHSSILNFNLCLRSAKSQYQYFQQVIHYSSDILGNIVLIGIYLCWLSLRWVNFLRVSGGGEGGGGSFLHHGGGVGGGGLFVRFRFLLLCLRLFQFSGWEGNFARSYSRHQISWFQYLSSIASLIQSFRVPF